MTITIPTVGIIGCGNYGVALALDYVRRTQPAMHDLNPNPVKLYATPDHRRIFNRIRQQRIVESTEAMTGRYPVDCEENLEALVDFAEFLVISLPSHAHDDIIRLLHPFKDALRRKTLVFVSGNGIAPKAYNILKPANVFETSRASYTCRVEEPADGPIKCRMNGFKTRTITASYLSTDAATLDRLEMVFGMAVEHYDDLLELLLVNNHGVLHPPTLLRGRYAIEQQAKMYTYRDLMSAPVCLEMQGADAELERLARALGCRKRESVLETLNGDYGTAYPDLLTFVRNIDALNKRPVLPPSMKSRMISQDVGVLGVLYVSLGAAVGVRMPVIESWIREASEINDTDYWANGRRLETYGLAEDASVDEIRSFFNARVLSKMTRTAGFERLDTRAALVC